MKTLTTQNVPHVNQNRFSKITAVEAILRGAILCLPVSEKEQKTTKSSASGNAHAVNPAFPLQKTLRKVTTHVAKRYQTQSASALGFRGLQSISNYHRPLAQTTQPRRTCVHLYHREERLVLRLVYVFASGLD